ncbi:hypothetical protein [Streptomyces sp. IBSBF 2806]|uniref:hypothetical protein n=1 Tax=Streptomyces sp. IBSBF 2806 TaxID=2903529 RepID=UPI002FDBE048
MLRVAVSGAIISASFVAFQSSASAAEFTGCRYAGNANSLKWANLTTRYEYSNPAQVAIAAWNSASTHFNFTNVNSGANLNVADQNFGQYVEGAAIDGLTSWRCSSGYYTETVTSSWNRYYTDGYPGIERKSVIVHEIGHALGLGDIEGSACVIMNGATPTRYGACGLSEPQPTDIARANSLY